MDNVTKETEKKKIIGEKSVKSVGFNPTKSANAVIDKPANAAVKFCE
jgi:hypothetical protein